MSTAQAVNVDHPIVIKVAINGANRKFKLPLRELNASTLPSTLRTVLQIPTDQEVIFERFSDSSGAYLTLDPTNPSAYKQLYRAAKAKLKLRLKVSYPDSGNEQLKKLQDEMPEPTPSIPVEVPESKPIDGSKPLPEVLQLEPENKVLPIGNTQPRDESVDHLVAMPPAREMSIRVKEAQPQPETKSLFWGVYCNNCDKCLSDAHFHCSICDKGDYDLCEACVNTGKLCPGEDHWLIKRFIKNDEIVNSTTERIAPVVRSMQGEKEPEVPGAFNRETDGDGVKTHLLQSSQSRTCNGCVRVLPERLLVECKDCDDFDLCMPCHISDKHGHHPAHTFKMLGSTFAAAPAILAKCEPGRNVSHNAICDKCDKKIVGVRHKCLDCPDWDCCNDCHKIADQEHPGHRFVPIYDALKANYYNAYEYTLHHGIYCDGPQCSGKANQGYIRGDRYKCAICHDTDFCANCEAHPNNKHNATHPLLKFKTPIKGVSVSTTGDDGQGQNLPVMGDRASVNPAPAAISNLKNLMATHPSTDTLPPAYTAAAAPALSEDNTIGLDAHFIKDVVVDGTSLSPGTIFAQTWTLRNPGPQAWPIGCSVRHVGGDDMLCIDRSKPIGADELRNARRSNAVSAATKAGEEVDFTIGLCAPTREGKHISYWRLHDPEGMPFGHKLWCDIDSKTTPTNAITPPIQQIGTATSGSIKSEKPYSGHLDYSDQVARLEAANKARLAQAHTARERIAAAAAGQAWRTPTCVQPASREAEIITSEKSGMTPGVAPPGAPIMPTINNAARLAMPNQMRVRAMELQNRHRVLREQWRTMGPQNVQERQKIGQEMQQLQQSMQQFAATYRSAAHHHVSPESNEMRELLNKQMSRREATRQLPEGEVKQQMQCKNVQRDNQEIMALTNAQRQRSERLAAQSQVQQTAGSDVKAGWAAPAPAARPTSETLQHQHQILAQRRAQALAEQRARYAATQRPTTTSGVQTTPMAPQSTVSQSAYATFQAEYAKQRAANMASYAQAQAQSQGAQQQMQMRHRAAMNFCPPQPSIAPISTSTSNASTTTSQVKPKAPTVEDIDPATEKVEARLQKTDMVMPKLEKDGSPASSMELKSEKAVSEKAVSEIEATTSDAAPSTAYSKANSTVSETTAGVADDLEDDFESVAAEGGEAYDDAESGVYSDDEGFDTDEYDILDASDEEAMENAHA